MAVVYIKQILGAVTYLHEKGIVHRDLKAENILFENEEENANIKLIDFGVSSKYKQGEKKMDEILGTVGVFCYALIRKPYYIAPEVLLQNYDSKCDV